MNENQMYVLFGADGKPLTKTLEQLQQELKEFQTALKTATDPAAISGLNKALLDTKKNITSLKEFQVGPNQSQLRQGTQTVFAFNQMLREMPAFAFSAQTGILALSNNIPIFMDRLKEARAGGQTFGSVFKELGKSLLSFPSLLTIGVSVLTIFGDKIFNTGKKAKEAANDYETFLKSIRDSGKIRQDATGGVLGQIAEVNALTKAVMDQTKSEVERGRALDRLKQINKEHFGNLTLQQTSLLALTKTTEEYTQALIKQAIISDISSEIGKVGAEYVKQQDAVNRARTSLDNYKQSNIAAIKAARAAGQNYFDASPEVTRLNAELAKQEALLRPIEQRYNELEGAINRAVNAGLKSKPLTVPKEVQASAEKAGKTLEELFNIVRAKQSEEYFRLSEEAEKGAGAYYDRLIKAMQRGNAEVNAQLQNVIAGGPKGGFSEFTKDAPTSPDSATRQLEENYLLIQKIRALGAQPIPTGYLSDVGAKNLLLKEQLELLTQMTEKQKEMALLVTRFLQPAMNSFFDTLVEGSGDPIQAFGNALKSLIKQMLATIATAAAMAAIFSLIMPGAGSFPALFKAFLGGGGVKIPGMGGGSTPGMANPSLNSGGMLGMASIQITGELRGRGSDLVVVIDNTLKSQRRTN